MTIDSILETLTAMFSNAGIGGPAVMVTNELDGHVFRKGDKTYRVSLPRLANLDSHYSIVEEIFWRLQYETYEELLRAFQVLQSECNAQTNRAEKFEKENQEKTAKIDELKDKLILSKGFPAESRKTLEALMVISTEAWRAKSKGYKTSIKDYEEKMKYLAEKVSGSYE